MSVVGGVECPTADRRLLDFIHVYIWKRNITWTEIWSSSFEGELQSFSFCYSHSDFGAGIAEDGAVFCSVATHILLQEYFMLSLAPGC